MCEPSCFYPQKPARRGRALAALMTVGCLLGVAARAEDGSSRAKATHVTATRNAPPAAKAVRGNNPVTVTGFVGDGNAHGWPLYASVEVTADGFSSTAYTHPTTGVYTIELFEGVEYEFTAHALVPGYIDEVRLVTPTAEPENQEFFLQVDLFTCSAQGYGTPLDEQFSTGTTPAGWELAVGSGTDVEWSFDDPAGRGNLTPGGTGGFAIIDSDHAESVPVDSELRTPVLDLSGQSGLTLRFATDLNIYGGGPPEVADVDVSVNGGGSWTNVFRRTQAQGDFNSAVAVPLPMLDGQPQAQLRFHYYNANYDSWWQVDNVKVGVAIEAPVPDFAESFDSPTFPPTDWTVHDLDGGSPIWVRTTTTHSGAGAATHTFGPSAGPNQDGWLVSPPIEMPAGALAFDFWERSAFPGDAVRHSLYFCVADCDSPPTNYSVLSELTIPGGTYRQQSVIIDHLAEQTVRIAFRYEGIFADGWFVDDVTVAARTPAFECGVRPGGLLVGTVFDDNTGGGVNGATVSAEGSSTTTFATPGDDALPDGFYSLFVQPASSRGGFPTIATATKAGFTTDEQEVVIVFDSAITQNFTLDAPKLNLPPVEVTVDFGGSTDVVITASNSGPGPLEFALFENGDTMEFARPPAAKAAKPAIKQPVPLPKVSRSNAQTHKQITSLRDSWDLAKQKGLEPGSDRRGSKHASTRIPDPPSDAFSNHFISIDDGTAENSIGLTAGGQFLWLNRFTPAPEDLPFRMNSVQVLFGGGPPGTGINPGELVDIYVYEDTDGDEDPGTNAVLRAQINDAAVQFVDGVKFSSYSLDAEQEFTGGDILVAVVNRTAGVDAGTFVASIDQTASQQRSWIGLYTADPPDPPPLPADDTFDIIDNLSATLAGNWMIRAGGIVEHDIVWLTVDPKEGSLDAEGGANDHLDINLGFDASVLDQPGKYIGHIDVVTDTPYDEPDYSVVMNVLPAEGTGKVTGLIRSLGYCDESPVPAPAARVEIGGVVADVAPHADGVYARWIDAGDYTVIVTLDGHITESQDVTVTAGGSTTANFDLRLEAPCARPDPTSISQDVAAGDRLVIPLHLENRGPVSYDFELLEAEGLFGASRRPVSVGPVRHRVSRTGGPAVGRLKAMQDHIAEAKAAGKKWPASKSEIVSKSKSTQSGSRLQGRDVRTPVWFTGVDLPTALFSYTAARCDDDPGHLYVYAGNSAADFTPSFELWRFDIADNTWTALAENLLPNALATDGQAAVCHDGEIHVFGGLENFAGTITNEHSIYDIETDEWSEGTPMPTVSWGPAAGVWDGKFYVMGGSAATASFDPVLATLIYDPATDTWTEGAEMSVGTSFMGYAQAGPFVYLVGGQDVSDAAGNINATQRYDMLADTWTDGPEFTSARADQSVGVTDHFIYAIGGDAADGFFWDATNDVERLDWTTWPDGAWETVSDEPAVANASMRTSFCTSGISTSEIWSIAGTQGTATGPGTLQDATQFRPNINEKCFSLFSDVPWLSENPSSGTVEGDSTLEGSIVLDSAGLELGTYEATIFMNTTDSRAPSFLIPVTMNVVEPVLGVELSGDPLADSGDPGTVVSYALTVTNTGNTTDSYNIVLSQDGTPWATVAPAVVGPLGPGASEEITVHVTVPSNALNGAADEVEVFAVSHKDDGVSVSQLVRTTANRVDRMSMTPGVSVKSTPGEAVTFTLHVTNTGNATDSYTVSKVVTGQPFVTTTPATVTSVAPNTSKSFDVTVTVPPNATGGASSTAQITLRSQANNSVSAVATLVTLVDVLSGALLTPTSVVQNGDAGEDVVFTLTVKNIGNLADAFDLSFTGATWETQLDTTSTAALAPGATQDVHLTVTVPQNVESGDLSSVIVTATSQSNGSIKASAAMVTRAISTVGAMSLAGAALLVLVLGAIAGVTRRRRSRLAMFK